MTILSDWLPDLSRRRGPRYRAIAEAIDADILAGRLPPGAQLPTHRDLAYRLGVTVGTVTRAYAEAERRGLVGGEVGRGTYVRRRVDAALADAVASAGAVIDLAMNNPIGGGEGAALAAGLARLAQSTRLPQLATYQPHLGSLEHRAAMVRFLALQRVEITADRIALTGGGQHGIFLALDAVARPGETVAADMLCFGGFKATARLLDLRVRGIGADAGGMRPDLLDALCRETMVRALYIVPNLQNPTGEVWSIDRRREIAEICVRYGVTIVEDDVYGYLMPEPPPSVASFAPDYTIYINSTSKSLASGLRIGMLAAPSPVLPRIAAGLRSTCWMAPPIMAELLALWVEDGTARALMEEKRRVGAERQIMARRILSAVGAICAPGHPNAFHVWLPLADPWRGEDLAAAARASGVLVSPGSAFAVGRGAPDGIRLSLGTPASAYEAERGVAIIAGLLRDGADLLADPL